MFGCGFWFPPRLRFCVGRSLAYLPVNVPGFTLNQHVWQAALDLVQSSGQKVVLGCEGYISVVHSSLKWRYCRDSGTQLKSSLT